MNQYCLKCGANLKKILKEGFQHSVCHSCGWTYYNNPRPCVTGVIYQKQNILFIRRLTPPGKGKWDFPGGFMEIGEHPDQALQREIREEIGCTLSHFRQLGFYPDYYDTDKQIPILNIVYLCQIHNDPQNRSDEFDQWTWFPISDLPETIAFQAMKNIIHDALFVIEHDFSVQNEK
ncbi:NUDIX hydrolase [bacterium]|nr:NUDIX hydrolase [bacterium]